MERTPKVCRYDLDDATSLVDFDGNSSRSRLGTADSGHGSFASGGSSSKQTRVRFASSLKNACITKRKSWLERVKKSQKANQNNFSNSENATTWYTREELQTVQGQVAELLRDLNEQPKQDDDVVVCSRGLEYMRNEDCYAARQEVIRAVVRAVLQEQDAQKSPIGAATTSETGITTTGDVTPQQRRENNKRDHVLFWEIEAVRRASLHQSSTSREDALKRGRKDALHALQIHGDNGNDDNEGAHLMAVPITTSASPTATTTIPPLPRRQLQLRRASFEDEQLAHTASLLPSHHQRRRNRSADFLSVDGSGPHSPQHPCDKNVRKKHKENLNPIVHKSSSSFMTSTAGFFSSFRITNLRDEMVAL